MNEDIEELKRKAEKYNLLVEMLEEEITYKNIEIAGNKITKFLFELLHKSKLKAGIVLVNAYRTELLERLEENNDN